MKNIQIVEKVSELFDRVQKEQVFEDQKTMADAIPLINESEIIEKYHLEKSDINFNLKNFIHQNYQFAKIDVEDVKPTDSITSHIDQLWEKLTISNTKIAGSLLALPKPYVIPGGRFLEFFYWDSYFVLLGLKETKKHDLIENIIDNCAFLINTYGFVPNGNRTYFLSRSQPPYFSLMLDVLAEIKGENIYTKYQKELLLEYQFWMDGKEDLLPEKNINKRVVLMPENEILNRYFDKTNQPRPESYLIDLQDFEKAKKDDFYSNIRSACESGWDFSGRWFRDSKNIETIETGNIVPIDLNCLLYKLENTIAKSFRIKGDLEQSNLFEQRANTRKNAIQKYFWNEEEGFYFDYQIKDKEIKKYYHIASVYPLFLEISTQEQSESIAKKIEHVFLKDGGVLTSDRNTGQQWDAPNGWAPNQWIAFAGLKNYQHITLAKAIKTNWCSNIERVYKNTGKLMEKYNVEDTSLIAGGGEYENQDGFGWTNGVYLKLKNETF